MTHRRAIPHQFSSGSAPWWPSGTDVLYVPAGAAREAAGRVNLANPGTYDATGTPASWSAAGGWAFGGSQFLSSGYTPPDTQSRWAVVAFTDGAAHRNNNFLFGCGTYNLARALAVASFDYSGVAKASNSSWAVVAGQGTTSGTFGLNGAYFWKNGVSIGGPLAYNSYTPVTDMLIGAIRYWTYYFYAIATIRAIAFGTGTLADADMAAWMATMGAL